MKFTVTAAILASFLSTTQAAPAQSTAFGLKIVAPGQPDLDKFVVAAVDVPNQPGYKMGQIIEEETAASLDQLYTYFLLNPVEKPGQNLIEGALVSVDKPSQPGGEVFRAGFPTPEEANTLGYDPIIFSYANVPTVPAFGFGKMNAFVREGMSGWYACKKAGTDENYLAWHKEPQDGSCRSVGVTVQTKP